VEEKNKVELKQKKKIIRKENSSKKSVFKKII
jgi:hypothetical protein